MMIANFKKVNFKKQNRNNQPRIRMYRFLPRALQEKGMSESGRIQQAFFSRKEIVVQPHEVVFFNNSSENCFATKRNKRRYKIKITYTIDIE